MVYDAMPDEIALVAVSIDEEIVGIFSSGVVGRATYFRWRDKPDWYEISQDRKARFDGPTDELKRWLQM